MAYKLFNDDCLNILGDIPENSVDFILTDPPYGINFQSCWIKDKSKRKPKTINDGKPFIDFIPFLKKIIKPTGCMMIFTRWDVQNVFMNAMQENGLKIKSIIIWDKIKHGMGDLKTSYANCYESIIFTSENEFRFPLKRPRNIISVKSISAQKLLHPNEKPVELLKILIEQCTNGDSLILDPFMGSGTTGVACINTGRDFIGIEIDENYFNIAKKRIENAEANYGNEMGVGKNAN